MDERTHGKYYCIGAKRSDKRIANKANDGDYGIWLKLKLRTNLCSAIKSEDSEELGSGTSQLGSQRGFDEREMF